MPEASSSSQANIISAVGLVKEFKDFWGRPKAKAVNDIDFEVRQGEVLGLLGPNGSGKSTTVKMLLGLLYPTGGRLTVFDRSPRDVDTKKLIGYLPEESYLYKHLTAMETLDFFGALFNLSAAERRARSEQLLDMVGLSHAKYRQVGEFSKGMARRIGLAQAMINDPALLILDEPTAGLDPIGCKEVKDLIKLLKRRGKTVIVTSHLLSDVEDVCDRVVILYGGRIRATGTLNELLTIHSSTRIVAPQLPPEVTERLLAILRESLKGESFVVDNPRMSLEDFFLDVVDKAKAESIETSGATSGGHIADYLSAGAAPEAGKTSSEVLKSLLSGKESAEASAVRQAVEEAAARNDAPKLDESKLKGLAAPEKPLAAPASVAVMETAKKAELSEANKKLDALLKPKGGGGSGAEQ